MPDRIPPNHIYVQGQDGIQGVVEVDDRFGSSLISGDFNNDGLDDLAIGVPFESVFFNGDDQFRAGAVNILRSRANGLTGSQIWTQAEPGIEGDPEGQESTEFFIYDRFGSNVGSGDFNGDGLADSRLVYRVRALVGSGNFDAGAVNVIYNSSTTFIPGLLARQ